jgi:hypothetical protein
VNTALALGQRDDITDRARWITDVLSQGGVAWFLNGEEIPLNEPEGCKVQRRQLADGRGTSFG